MNLILGFEILIGGVATDADQTPVLRDDTLAWGVRRTDTGEVLVPVVPAPAQYTRTGTGAYQYTLADAVAGVTYEYAFEAVVDGTTYHGTKVKTAPPDVSGVSYQSVDEAEALAATLPASTPGLAAYQAWDATAKAALAVLATVDVDNAMPYQGRRLDPAQSLEFPRLAYTAGPRPWTGPVPPLPGAVAYGGGTQGPAAGARGGGGMDVLDPDADQVWDWDDTNKVGVVPPAVKLAHLLQMCDLAAGDRQERLQAIADGLASQAVGSLSETYRPDAVPAALCARAHAIMRRYRLRQGRML